MSKSALDKLNIDFDELLNSSIYGVLVQSLDNKVLYANKASSKLLGISNNKLISSKLNSLNISFVKEDGTPFKNEAVPDFLNTKAIKKGRVEQLIGIKKRSQDTVWFITVSKIEAARDKSADFVITTFRDITKLKEAQLKIEQTNKRYQYAFEASKDGIWDWDLETNKVYFSPRWKKMIGYNVSEVKSDFSEWERLVHPDDIMAAYKAIEDYISGATSNYQIEFRLKHKKGHWVWVLSRGKIVEFKKNTPTRIIGTHTDITELKQLNLKLQVYQDAVMSSSESIVITDSDGKVIFANRATENITGYKVDEIIGQKSGSKDNWGGLMEKDYYQNMWNVLVGEGKPYVGEVTNKRKNGERYIAKIHVSPIKNSLGNVEHYVANESDITNLKETERTKQRLDSFFSLAINFLCILDENLWVNKASNSFKRLLKSDARSKDRINFLSLIHPEDKQSAEGAFKSILQNEKLENYKVRILIGELNTYEWTNWSGSKSNDGMIYIIGQNVNEEEHLNKLKSEFIALASHQLRTPLSAINWYTEMLLDEDAGSLNVEQVGYLQLIKDSNTRMVRLIESFLNVSRIDAKTFQVVPKTIDIDEIYNEVLLDLSAGINDQDITVTYNNSLNFKPNFDPDLYRIILTNLLSNAVKYSNKNSQVKINVYHEDDNIVISVTDFGLGIPDRSKHDIFSRLYRADNINKHNIEGNGLGLYMVKQITTFSGGTVYFDSEENKGSTFYIRYPKEGMKSIKAEKRLISTGGN